MSNRFADTTKVIQSRLPYWMKAPRTNNNSLAAQFMNVMGLAVDDINYVIDYAYAQTRIDKVDADQVDTVYKAYIPSGINPTYKISVQTDMFLLTPVDTIEEFFMATDTDKIHSEIQFPNPFFVDYDKHIIYVRKPYTINSKIGMRVTITDVNNISVLDEEIELVYSPVWNFFDEFGLLLCLPRLYKEGNLSYKNRILDVFIHPGNATRTGLMNGIARELGLRNIKWWDDGGEDYVIFDKMIVVNSIEVDNIFIGFQNIFVNGNNNIVIRGNESFRNIKRSVTYISNLEMHSLSNDSDKVMQSQIDTPDKQMLQYILEIINSKAPVMWGSFIWDEAFWDVANDVTSYTSTKLDALFTPFGI